MSLDVRSLGEWVKDVFGRGRLSGGGPLAAASLDLDDAVPVPEQQGTCAVSGGMLRPDQRTQHGAGRSRHRA